MNHFCHTVGELRSALAQMPDDAPLVSFPRDTISTGLHDATIQISKGEYSKAVFAGLDCGLKLTKKKLKQLRLDK